MAIAITPRLLARMPLPAPDHDGDKEARGRVLVVAGARSMPGGAILAATASLRAGAGKLAVATCASVAPLVAALVPEAYVVALDEAEDGACAPSAAEAIAARAKGASAVLVGPGMEGERSIGAWLPRALEPLRDRDDAVAVLDAAALAALARDPSLLRPLDGRAIVTPHAGEMAMLTGASKDDVRADPERFARFAADRFACVVVLKGSESFVASPGGAVHCNRAGNVGLATSGSGDALSGVIAGLAARGADPTRAAVWGVHAHAKAGERLAREMAPMGYLARELLAAIPRELARAARRPTATRRSRRA